MLLDTGQSWVSDGQYGNISSSSGSVPRNGLGEVIRKISIFHATLVATEERSARVSGKASNDCETALLGIPPIWLLLEWREGIKFLDMRR